MNQAPNNQGQNPTLRDVVNHIKENGVPSTEEMRDVVNHERNKRAREAFMQDVQTSLDQYRILFGKFKSNTASAEEIARMTVVSDHLLDLLQKQSQFADQ